MDSLKISTALRFVMLRAMGEAAAMSQKEVFPEHLLLGIFKFAELSAEEIAPTSRHKKEMDEDIGRLKENFAGMQVDTKEARAQLRRILYYEPPLGDSAALVEKLMIRALGHAKKQDIYPSALLAAILEDPAPAVRAVLRLPEKRLREEKETAGMTEREESGPAFLSSLTAKIRNMRYSLLDRVYGQDSVIHTFSEGLFAAEVLAAADEERRRPKAVFVFAGPPGVGKTFLAEEATKALQLPFKQFDMSAFSDIQAHIQLIGFAKSFKDAGPGLLTGFVREHPQCILIFDEIEKAGLTTIQIFLQLLDAGRLHDDYLDEEVSFRETILIFTTNAGRQLYEGDQRQGAAGFSRRTLLSALRTDLNPQTGKPFFPSAICSRLASGCLIMFSGLCANDLLRIGAAELQRCCALLKKQYGIEADFDEKLPAVLLFAEGGQADARMLRAQSELFFKNELFKIFRLWSDHHSRKLEDLHHIHFTLDMNGLPERVLALFENKKKTRLLVFGDEIFASRLGAEAAGLEVFGEEKEEGAFGLLARQEIHLVLLRLPELKAAEKREKGTEETELFGRCRRFFRELRERMPQMPIYLLEREGQPIDAELENAFMRAGARGKLRIAQSNITVFIEEIEHIAALLYLQTAAENLSTERKLLRFETRPLLGSDRRSAEICLQDFDLQRALEAEDSPHLLDEVERPKVRFSDVIGAAGAKEELRFFIRCLRDPKAFAARGMKAPRGVLLHGPSGTGKTLLARAMAGESEAAFIAVTASSFVTKWQGSGPESVRELFERARRYAPSIIFIDEIDAIGRLRGSGQGHGEEMALNALLTEMDGFLIDRKRPVFVLAATNFEVEEIEGSLRVIDPALSRRFDRKILVDLPNRQERRDYLRYALAKHEGHQIGSACADRLAERSAGLSPADLESVIEMAARTAVKQETVLEEAMLEEAFEVFRHGERRDWGEEYLERVARHEAGHAYLCYLSGNIPSYLTIVARGKQGGYTENADMEKIPLQTKEELLSRIRIALAGRAAEIVCYGDEEGISTGASGDLKAATHLAKAMLARYGMDEEFGMASLSREEIERGPLAAEIQTRVNRLLRQQMKRTLALIRGGKETLERLSAVLLAKNTLSREEIEEILTKEEKQEPEDC